MVRSKAVNHKILAILPGPTIPSNMRPYLLRTMLDFERLGLGALQGNTPGLKVWCFLSAAYCCSVLQQ